jgi:hypothetical protein
MDIFQHSSQSCRALLGFQNNEWGPHHDLSFISFWPIQEDHTCKVARSMEGAMEGGYSVGGTHTAANPSQ